MTTDERRAHNERLTATRNAVNAARADKPYQRPQSGYVWVSGGKRYPPDPHGMVADWCTKSHADSVALYCSLTRKPE